jgi:hypothetical protein
MSKYGLRKYYGQHVLVIVYHCAGSTASFSKPNKSSAAACFLWADLITCFKQRFAHTASAASAKDQKPFKTT